METLNELTFFIGTKNRSSLLFESLRSLEIYSPEAQIIVGNSSSDDEFLATSEVIKCFKNASEVVFSPDPGFALVYSKLFDRVRTKFAAWWTDDAFLLRPISEYLAAFDSETVKLVALPMLDVINFDSQTWPVDSRGCVLWETPTGRCAHYAVVRVEHFKNLGNVCGDGSSMSDVCDNFFHKNSECSERFWPSSGPALLHSRYADSTRAKSMLALGNYRYSSEAREKLSQTSPSKSLRESWCVKSEDLDKSSILAEFRSKNPLIFDIGCYDGEDSIEFLRLLPTAEVYAFDADPRSISLFEKRRSEEEKSRIKLQPLAVSNINGLVPWFSSNSESRRHFPDQTFWSASSSLNPPRHSGRVFPDINFTQTSFVESVRLDTWVEHNRIEGHIDLIWLDVNGAEVSFILGAQETLKKTLFLYTEFSKTENGQLFVGAPSIEDLCRLLPNFDVQGVYSYLGNYGNVLLRNRHL